MYRSTRDQVATPGLPLSGRATQEIIPADLLVEELSAPQPVQRPVFHARQHLSAGYEVLEEAEMLEAMAAQAAPKTAAADLVVDSGEFEIVSAEDAEAASSVAEAVQAPAPSESGVPASTMSPSPSKPTDPVSVTGDPVKEEPKAGEHTPSSGEPKKPDKDASAKDKGETPSLAETSAKDKKAEPPPVRRGLMAALAGRTVESEGKQTAEKKPPPSPFDSRGKK